MLGVLTQQWAPQAMAISFKLETDQSLLIGKVRTRTQECSGTHCPPSSSSLLNNGQAGAALVNYHVHAVIANILHTRKDVVSSFPSFVPSSHCTPCTDCLPFHFLQVSIVRLHQDKEPQVEEVLRPEGEPRIEKLLVARVVQLHQEFRQQ